MATTRTFLFSNSCQCDSSWASSSRQAATPAQKYARPRERSVAGGVVETVLMLGSLLWDGGIVRASTSPCPDQLVECRAAVPDAVTSFLRRAATSARGATFPD